MTIEGLLITLLVGAIAGWLAGQISLPLEATSAAF